MVAMYFIPVYGIPPCSDIMHAPHYGACKDGYAVYC